MSDDIDLIEEGKDEDVSYSAMAIPFATRNTALNYSRDFREILLGEPQKIREGRESYYMFSLQLKNQQLASRRYSDFLWLKGKLAIEFPGCVTTSLPEKEGLYSFWGSQDPMFLSFRRYGLEMFVVRIACNPKLSASASFITFVKEDELAFKSWISEDQGKGWFGTISEWSHSMTTYVSSCVYGDQVVLNNETDHMFNQSRNDIRNLYLQQTTLCEQGKDMVKQLEAEINSNFALAKAYENMSKVEKESLEMKLKAMAETHYTIADIHKASFNSIKSLVGQEMEDCRRYTFGLLEAFDRRNRLRAEENQGRVSVDMPQLNADLKQAIESFNSEKKFLSQKVCNQIILYKQEVTERVANAWREAYNKILG